VARLAKMPNIADHLHACTMCGFCVPVCPTYQQHRWETSSPRGKVFLMRQYEDRGPLDRLLRRDVTPDDYFARAVFECTACGACENVCMVDIPFDTLWQDVKSWMVASGKGMPEHLPTFENVRRTYNIYGEPHAERGAWIPPEAVQSGAPEVVYWVGCAASYRKQQIARAVVKILNAAKVKYRILGTEEWCSGGPLLNMGFGEYVKKVLMPHNLAAIAQSGAKILVTACAEDYRAFRKDYKRYGGNPPFSVLHVTQYIEELVKEKRLAFTKPLPNLKLAFHDACQLGRVSQIYDAPRTMMKYLRGVTVLEMVHTKDETLCSGAAAGYPEAFPAQADDIASGRIEEARGAGGTTIGTTCPFAEAHLERVSRQQNAGIAVVDLVELAAQAL